jgi:hypothetical protein
MRVAERLAALLRGLSPLVAAGGLVAAQLVVIAALARSSDWTFSTRDAAAGAALLSAELILLYGVALSIGGRVFALGAGALWVVAPVLLLRYWVVGGSPSTDFGVVYREQFLPAAYGLDRRAAVAAACLLLASGWLALGLRSRTVLAGAAAGAAVGAAALVHPLVWPALAAPVLALAVARRPRAAVACAAAALAALGALALFRHVPGIHPGYHTIGTSLDQLREFAWSRRVLEYLPLAGLIGVARRSPPAAAFLGWLFLAVIIAPLGRPLSLLELLFALVPALPVYALLTACIVFLVPKPRPATAREPATR